MLAKALSIVKRDEHYKVDSQVRCCCNSQDHIPQDLFDKLYNPLELVKARNALIKETLEFLPLVLVDLMLDYAPNRHHLISLFPVSRRSYELNINDTAVFVNQPNSNKYSLNSLFGIVLDGVYRGVT